MCCLFGLIDTGLAYSGKEKAKILHVLASCAELRGTDAAGYALMRGASLVVKKYPLPGREISFSVRDSTTVVMGHTRMTTQGDASRNENNHPFLGKVSNRPFALAHNGVIHNDLELRKVKNLPKTKIETDSYIAVQLIESQQSLGFDSLRYMAEQVRGTFTFTVLSDKGELYCVRGDNPMCLLRFERSGLFLYASTREIVLQALENLPFLNEKPNYIEMHCGTILKVDTNGEISRSQFDDSHLDNFSLFWPMQRCVWSDPQNDRNEYIHDLKLIAAGEGYHPEVVDCLLRQGFTLWEIEDFIYEGAIC